MDAEILVVGAGVCGLATALELSRQGRGVLVLEKREDGTSERGRRALSHAATLLASANGRLARHEPAGRDLAEVESIRRRYWGLKERNVLVDARALRFLEKSGLNVDELPELDRMTIESMDGSFLISVDPLQGSGQPVSENLDAEELLLRRSYQAQPTLGELERRLRGRLEQQAVPVRFGHHVVKLEETERLVHATTRDGRRVTAAYAVIADGGAASSLVHSSTPGKRPCGTEPMCVAVYRAVPGVTFLGHDIRNAFTHTRLTALGWIAAFCDGRNLTVATNACPDAMTDPDWPMALLEFLGAQGLEAPLAEAPFRVDGATAISRAFTVGNRILIAGDAAMTGNPRFGLGVQYCMLWAQEVGRCFRRGESDDPDLVGYEAFGTRVTERRLGFERAWIDTIDGFSVNGWGLGDPNVASLLDRGLDRLQLWLDARGREGALCTIDAALDLGGEEAGPDAAPLARMVAAYQVVEIAGQIELQPAVDAPSLTLEARLSPDQALVVRLGSCIWIIEAGTLRMERLAAGWRLELREAAARLGRLPGASSPEFGSSMPVPLEAVQLTISDTLLERLTASTPLATSTPKTAQRLIRLDFELEAGASPRWGPFQVETFGQPSLRIAIGRRADGAPRLTLELVSGRFAPIDFQGFVRQSELKSARWLAQLSALTRGATDPLIDQWSAMAGSAVRRIVVDLAADGSALATMNAGLPLSFRLPPADVDALRQALYSPGVLAGMAEEYWMRWRRAQPPS